MKLFKALAAILLMNTLYLTSDEVAKISPFDYTLESLISKQQIEERISLTARVLEKEYKDAEEVVFISLLKGALPFTMDLMKETKLPITLECVKASSYGQNGTVSGKLVIQSTDHLDIQNKHIVLIDDICDTGKTLKNVVAQLQKQNPLSIKTVVLLSKRVRSMQDFHPDIALFEIEDKFVVGYGLDFKEYYRTLDSIYVLGYYE